MQSQEMQPAREKRPKPKWKTETVSSSETDGENVGGGDKVLLNPPGIFAPMGV